MHVNGQNYTMMRNVTLHQNSEPFCRDCIIPIDREEEEKSGGWEASCCVYGRWTIGFERHIS